MPPPGLRPKLRADQVLDLGIVHAINLAAIADGQAEPDLLWDLVESVLCWSHAAELSGRGVEEMNEQLALTTRLIERYRRTGKVRFDGPDYQLAKTGRDIMDELAASVDLPTAIAASEWSRREVARMEAACRTLEPA